MQQFRPLGLALDVIAEIPAMLNYGVENAKSAESL